MFITGPCGLILYIFWKLCWLSLNRKGLI